MKENIRARRAFFTQGAIDAFLGHLNSLSSSSIFESCVLPCSLVVGWCDMVFKANHPILSRITSDGNETKTFETTIFLLQLLCSTLPWMATYGVQDSDQEIQKLPS